MERVKENQTEITAFANEPKMDKKPEGEKEVDVEKIRKATEILKKYKSGKANLERRVIDNEQWWKLRHWDTLRHNGDKSSSVEPTSAWLFNSIANKHADAMDNFPAVTVLPRAEDDRATAEKLSEIVPAILDANNYQQVYSDIWWYKLKQGTGVSGVFWDNNAARGLGDIVVKKMDLLNLFWEPGITDIQKSPNLFSVELRNNHILKKEYPEFEFMGTDDLGVSKYIYDDTVDTSNCSLVVDWYYKKIKTEYDGNGQPYTRQVLHYCKFVGENIIYASENDPNYAESGYYDHGQFPFVFDVLYPEEGTPAGFGCIDLMKSDQEYIDKLDQAILENAIVSSKKRYFIRQDGTVNADDFLNLSKPLIPCQGNVGEDSIREVKSTPLSSIYYNVKQGKIDELKETSGNRDFSQGATSSGVTAASAISALQEAGSKLSRDMLKSSYRAFTNQCYLIIELIRQFYTEPRVFRITGETDYTFETFDNSALVGEYQGNAFGIDLGNKIPFFDIRVNAEKSSTYSRMSQNELALQFYGQGFFNPQNASPTLACLEMMDFEGKQNVMRKIKQGMTLEAEISQLKEQMVKLMQIVDAQNGSNLMGQYEAENPSVDANGGSAPKPNLDQKKTLSEKSRDMAASQATPK